VAWEATPANMPPKEDDAPVLADDKDALDLLESEAKEFDKASFHTACERSARSMHGYANEFGYRMPR
jgi:hypothetical protein